MQAMQEGAIVLSIVNKHIGLAISCR